MWYDTGATVIVHQQEAYGQSIPIKINTTGPPYGVCRWQ